MQAGATVDTTADTAGAPADDAAHRPTSSHARDEADALAADQHVQDLPGGGHGVVLRLAVVRSAPGVRIRQMRGSSQNVPVQVHHVRRHGVRHPRAIALDADATADAGQQG